LYFPKLLPTIHLNSSMSLLAWDIVQENDLTILYKTQIMEQANSDCGRWSKYSPPCVQLVLDGGPYSSSKSGCGGCISITV